MSTLRPGELPAPLASNSPTLGPDALRQIEVTGVALVDLVTQYEQATLANAYAVTAGFFATHDHQAAQKFALPGNNGGYRGRAIRSDNSEITDNNRTFIFGMGERYYPNSREIRQLLQGLGSLCVIEYEIMRPVLDAYEDHAGLEPTPVQDGSVLCANVFDMPARPMGQADGGSKELPNDQETHDDGTRLTVLSNNGPGLFLTLPGGDGEIAVTLGPRTLLLMTGGLDKEKTGFPPLMHRVAHSGGKGRISFANFVNPAPYDEHIDPVVRQAVLATEHDYKLGAGVDGEWYRFPQHRQRNEFALHHSE